jgi:ATP-dependent DNA helicase RecG
MLSVFLRKNPIKAVREIILNALIHRDYSIHTDNSPIRIILFDDRLEVDNPGGLYGRITIDDLGKMSADTRNPFIAGALEILIDTENRFSGIPTIYNEMKTVGLKPPVFESKRGVFKITLYNESDNKDNKKAIAIADNLDISQKILLFCSEPRSIEELAEYLGIDSPYYMVTRYIKPLIEKGNMQMTLPDTPKSKNQQYFTINRGY